MQCNIPGRERRATAAPDTLGAAKQPTKELASLGTKHTKSNNSPVLHRASRRAISQGSWQQWRSLDPQASNQDEVLQQRKRHANVFFHNPRAVPASSPSEVAELLYTQVTQELQLSQTPLRLVQPNESVQLQVGAGPHPASQGRRSTAPRECSF